MNPFVHCSTSASPLHARQYLFLWVAALLKADRLDDLTRYTLQSLVQLQHMAISASLGACGLLDMLHAYAIRVSGEGADERRSGSELAHSLWCLNLSAIGLVFMLHPQKSVAADSAHLYLGLSLVCGAHFLCHERRRGWISLPDSGSLGLEVLLAAVFFGCASIILIVFEEGAHVHNQPHQAVLAKWCQPGLQMSVVAAVLAVLSIAAGSWHALKLAAAVPCSCGDAAAVTRRQGGSEAWIEGVRPGRRRPEAAWRFHGRRGEYELVGASEDEDSSELR